MTLQTGAARALDVFGNPIASAQNGRLKFEVSPRPIYLVTDSSPDVLADALNRAELSGLDEIAAQLLPLSRDPRASEPGSAAIRIRLQKHRFGAAARHR